MDAKENSRMSYVVTSSDVFPPHLPSVKRFLARIWRIEIRPILIDFKLEFPRGENGRKEIGWSRDI